MLAYHHFISREAGSGTRQVIDRYLQDAGLSPGMLQVAIEAGSTEAVKSLIVSGMGFSLASKMAVEKEVSLKLLVRRPLMPALKRHLSAIYPRERMHSRLITSFLNFTRDRLLVRATSP